MSYIADIPVYERFNIIIQKYKNQGLSVSEIVHKSLSQINEEISQLSNYLRMYECEDDYLSEKLAYKGQGTREYEEYQHFCKEYGDYSKHIEDAVEDRKKAISEIRLYFYFEGSNALTRARKEFERSGEISQTNQAKVQEVLDLSNKYAEKANELAELEQRPQSYMYMTRIQELKSELSLLPFENEDIAFDFIKKSKSILEKIQTQPGE